MSAKYSNSFGSGQNRMLAEQQILDGMPVGRPQAGSKASTRPAKSVTVNLSESPLGWLHARGHLDDRQFDAGEKLRLDFECAQLMPSITMRWDASPIGGPRRGARDHLEPGERQIAAKQRFDAAMTALGRDLNDIAWRAICSVESLPDAERALGWPARSGKLVLRLALDRLADHYRLPLGY